MNGLKNKKGSAIITAVGMGIVLLIVIAGVFSFSKYRTQTVINESKKVKALALAEAGLEVALGELFNNSTFQTHSVKINGQELEWDSAQTRECTLEANNENDHNFNEESSNSGTISGTLGDGKFKVRVGNIPYKDNENTKAVDESKAYVKIEAMGIYDKTVRKIEAVVNRRYPSREFLMYDGKILSVVYGQTGDSNNSNVFSIGHLYGHEGIEISQILNSAQSPTSAGTKQKLYNIDAVLSGAGGIFFYSDVEATFFNKSGQEAWKGTMKKNATFPSNGTYKDGDKEFGGFPEELKNQTPAIPEEISNWVKDKNSGISIPPRTPSFEQYKDQAQKGGGILSSAKSYKVTKGYGSSINAVYLDFGSGKSNIRKGNVNNFPSNGIFYSDKDIIIKGNPPKDVSIVSEKNVFVTGDFNQNGSGSGQQKYCYPQDYPSGKNALTADDYIESYKDDFKKDTESKDGDPRVHVSATIVAKERIVFDHRSAVDCCENELYPYLKYELAKAISDQPNESEAAKVLNPNDCSSVGITASESIDGFKANIATFATNFNISESSLSELDSVYNSTNNGKFSDSDLDKLTEVTWNAFKKDYTGGDEYSGSVNSDDKCAVNMLMFKLRAKMCGKNPDDIKDFFEPKGSPTSIQDKQGDYLFYPEMTTNGMFISCGKINNTFYSGPDVKKYFNEIGYSSSSKSAGVSNKWYESTEGLLHRTFGSETNLRLHDVKRISESENAYYPPTRKKVYDDTLIKLGNYDKNNLELSGFVVLSWQDLAANEEEFEAF